MSEATNLDEARRFLELIDTAGEPALFQTFDDDDSRKTPALISTTRGTLDQVGDKLARLNSQGAGVFVTINRVAGNRRLKKNVDLIRALFADHDERDEGRDFAQYGLEPSLVVESSPGKHHAYWLVETLIEEFPVDEFSAAQATIASTFGTDPKVNDLSRVMRLPGFWHRKGEPFRTRIIHESGTRYSATELRDWLAGMTAPEKAPETPSAPAQATIDGPRDRYAESAIERALGALWNAGTGERNDTLNTQALGLFGLVKAGRLDGEHVTARLRETASAIGLTGNETEATLRSAWNAAKVREEGMPAPTPASVFHDLTRNETEARMLIQVGEILRNIKPTEWRVRGYLEAESVAVLFGSPGAGKSFLAIAWSACVATGTYWLGHKVRQSPVVYVAGEGHQGFAKRAKAWQIENETPLADAPLHVSRKVVPFLDATAVKSLADEIDALPEPPGLIVIDTLARAIVGGSENDAEDMGRFIQACDALKERYRSTVLVVHHSGHVSTERARGHSSLKGAADAEFGMLRDDQERPPELRAFKMKDADLPPPMTLELESVELPGLIDDEGEPVTSAVLRKGDAPLPKSATKPLSKTQRLALETLVEVADSDGAHLETWGAAFKTRHWGDNAAAKRQAFRRARETLEGMGAINVLNDVYRPTPERCSHAEVGEIATAFTLLKTHDRDSVTGRDTSVTRHADGQGRDRDKRDTPPLRGVTVSRLPNEVGKEAGNEQA